MVAQGKTELRLDLTAADGEHVYQTFQNFRLRPGPYYTLYIDRGVGTAGNEYHYNYKTKRKNNNMILSVWYFQTMVTKTTTIAKQNKN
jgi:hypothetical protein